MTMKATESGLSWVDAIAAAAGCGSDMVESYLERHRIRASPVLPSPTGLILRRVRFSGVRSGREGDDAFEFEWDKLEAGLWGIGAPGNLVGKSSIIEIIKWLLRGDPPSSLQSDVRGFLRIAELEFTVAGEYHLVRVRTEGGTLSGSLSKLATASVAGAELATFSSERQFKEVMSDFMMRRFALDSVYAWHSDGTSPDGGRSQEHGWPALSGVLSIGTELKALLGENTADGLAGRLILMFIGLPWVTTLTEALTALRSVQAAREVAARSAREAMQRHSARIDELKAALAEVRTKLRATPDAEALIAEARRISLERSRIYRDLADAEARVAAAERLLAEATENHDGDRIALHDFLAEREAGIVFGGLVPVCCPRCETRFGRSQKEREGRGDGCMVCGIPSVPGEQDDRAREAQLRFRSGNSGTAVATARSLLTAARRKVDDLGATRTALEAEAAKSAVSEDRLQTHQLLSLEEHGLAARISELSVPAAPGEAAGPDGQEESIAKACEKITRDLATSLQKEVLSEVSSELVLIARRFGMNALTSATLRGNGSLSLEKGGDTTGFSGATVGERLRLKVATTIAILAVGQRRGVGRHPGVLMIDSPGAQEMETDNLDAMFEGLVGLVGEMKNLQVIVATAQVDALAKWVPEARLKGPQPGGRMW